MLQTLKVTNKESGVSSNALPVSLKKAIQEVKPEVVNDADARTKMFALVNAYDKGDEKFLEIAESLNLEIKEFYNTLNLVNAL